jgi:ubiquinone/menaquinone biosynthesis C-methylase UbiE
VNEVKNKKIKNFWDEQAERFKGTPLAGAPDIFYQDLEIDRIISYLKDGKKVLDIGCGNGNATLKLADKFPHSDFLGVDYSEKMIKYARQGLSKNKELKNRVIFEIGDVNKLSSFLNKKFDYVISKRCLINLLNWNDQKKAILEMKKVLKKDGSIILCENTKEGLDRLNVLRKEFRLKPISVRWHNCYLPEKKLLGFLPKYFKVADVNNIGSLYYILSRVVHAKLSFDDGKEPDYLHPINKIASKLPSVGNYSSNFIFFLKNR